MMENDRWIPNVGYIRITVFLRPFNTNAHRLLKVYMHCVKNRSVNQLGQAVHGVPFNSTEERLLFLPTPYIKI